MPPVVIEPTIPVSSRPQTYALDGVATGIGLCGIKKQSYIVHPHKYNVIYPNLGRSDCAADLISH
jgi:hypothetical protein